MNAEEPDSLHALPVQVIDVEDGVIVRRGTSRMRVRGPTAKAAVYRVIDAFSGPAGATAQAVALEFAEGESREAISMLVSEFAARRFLVPMGAAAAGGEGGSADDREDVFYWTFGTERPRIEAKLHEARLALVGVNSVSAELARALVSVGFSQPTVVDFPLLRSVRYFTASGALAASQWQGPPPVSHERLADSLEGPDCIVATSDFGGLALMRDWNSFCVDSGITFYPVVMQDLVGYAGPLVVPGETACFECFWARQGSNLEGSAALRESDSAAFQGQIVDPYLQPMATILANVAAFELLRHYSQAVPGHRCQSVLEIDLVGSAMDSRRLMRVPRCPVCGAQSRHGRVSLELDEQMPGNAWLG